MRNILAHVGQSEKAAFASRLKQIWLQPSREMALQVAGLIIREYEDRFPKAIEVLQEGLEDSLQFHSLPDLEPKRIASTNMQERLHREIRRRSRVVGIFPSEESYVRLVSCYLIEYAEDWATARSYVRAESIERCRAKLKPAA